jgi:two-component system NarL family sensor kinase
LTNIERHAHAQNVYIDLQGTRKQVQLTVRDDGVGFRVDVANLQEIQGGIGLRNIRERVEHFHGQLNLYSAPGHSELTVTMPVSVAA